MDKETKTKLEILVKRLEWNEEHCAAIGSLGATFVKGAGGLLAEGAANAYKVAAAELKAVIAGASVPEDPADSWIHSDD